MYPWFAEMYMATFVLGICDYDYIAKWSLSVAECQYNTRGEGGECTNVPLFQSFSAQKEKQTLFANESCTPSGPTTCSLFIQRRSTPC